MGLWVQKSRLADEQVFVARVILVISCAALCAGPAAAGVEPEAIRSELEAIIPQIFSARSMPSLQVAVVERDRVLWSVAYGEETGIDHVYMNGSVHKVVDATAVLQLVERGLVDLDADVGAYVPFAVRHPDFPETPVTVRMMLAHRSGLDALRHQFSWDTGCAFSPRFRPDCNSEMLDMSLGEFLAASLPPEGSNYDPGVWVLEPGRRYRYSVSTYPFLRYLIEQVTGSSYPDYVRDNIFEPLEMTHSGFGEAGSVGPQVFPYTRIDGENVRLPIWGGNGYMMLTTAEDMARFMIAYLNDGRYGGFQLLEPETIKMMSEKSSRFGGRFRRCDDLCTTGHGLGLFVFSDGWLGHGGSTPGFQCLWRYHRSEQVGYVILTNVNAILGGGDNYESVRGDIYAVQNALLSTLDPPLVFGLYPAQLAIAAAISLIAVAAAWGWRRRMRARV